MRQAITSAGSGKPVWSWSGDNRVAFWVRLGAHEAAIHRTDAESAFGPPNPIPTLLAAEGKAIDLVLFLRNCLPPDRLHVQGDRSLLTHYHDLAAVP